MSTYIITDQITAEQVTINTAEQTAEDAAEQIAPMFPDCPESITQQIEDLAHALVAGNDDASDYADALSLSIEMSDQ